MANLPMMMVQARNVNSRTWTARHCQVKHQICKICRLNHYLYSSHLCSSAFLLQEIARNLEPKSFTTKARTNITMKHECTSAPQPVKMPKDSKVFLLAYRDRAVIARTIVSKESAQFYTPTAALSDEWISALQKMK